MIMLSLNRDGSVKVGIAILLLFIIVHRSTALLCYSCRDVTDNEDCLNVTVCGDSDAVQTTSEPGRFTFCNHICQEDLCNLKLCTVKVNSNRPPRCLSCAFVKKPGDCDTIKICNQNEDCYVDEFRSFGEVRYRLGCVNKQICEKMQPVSSAALVVGKRSQSSSSGTCTRCCSGDHCNGISCSNTTRDQGLVGTLKMIQGNACEDKTPEICAGYKLLSKDSCKISVVQKNCGKSCGICGRFSWSEWQSWGNCNQSCGTNGIRTRHRGCSYTLDHLKKLKCTVTSSETQSCNRKICPVDGRWCYSTEETGCVYGYGAYRQCTGTKQVRTNRCGCPAPAYGGRNCS